MDFEPVELEEIDSGIELSQENDYQEESEENNDFKDVEIHIPDELKSGNREEQRNEENVVEKSNFAESLRQELGWEGVPDDASPIETIKLLSQMQQDREAVLLARIQELESNVGNYDIEIQEYTKQFEDFKKLSPKDVVKQTLMKRDGLTEEEAEEDVSDLELEGKIDKEYRRIIRREEKQFNETLELKKQQKTQQQEIRKQQEEIERKELVTNVKSEIQSFSSEYFDVTPQDRQMIERAILEPMENGFTLLQNILSDNKAIAEMILAYQYLPQLKKLPKTIQKKVESKILNNLSDNPVFNSKVTTKGNTMEDWAKSVDEIPTIN